MDLINLDIFINNIVIFQDIHLKYLKKKFLKKTPIKI